VPNVGYIYNYGDSWLICNVIFGLVDLDCSRFFTVSPNEQLVGILVSCLCVIVVLMSGSIFFVTVS